MTSINKTLAIPVAAFLILAGIAGIPSAHAQSEVTGTLTVGAAATTTAPSGTITGTVTPPGTGASGTITGTVGGGSGETITDDDDDGDGGSGGGGGVGGGGIDDDDGEVLGATTVFEPLPPVFLPQTLGATTFSPGLPNTGEQPEGAGPSAGMALTAVLSLAALAGSLWITRILREGEDPTQG